MKLENVETYVLQALEENSLARKDDFILYGAVLKRMGIDINLSLSYIFFNAKKLKIPAMATVMRSRRKIFETRPELADENTQVHRQEKIKDYINYAINN